MRAILSAKAAWSVVKKAEVAAKVQTVVIMDRKSRGEIEIVSMGDVEVLSPAESVGTRGTGGADDADSGSMADGAMDAGMWGSSSGITGGGSSSVGSLSGR